MGRCVVTREAVWRWRFELSGGSRSMVRYIGKVKHGSIEARYATSHWGKELMTSKRRDYYQGPLTESLETEETLHISAPVVRSSFQKRAAKRKRYLHFEISSRARRYIISRSRSPLFDGFGEKIQLLE